MGPTVWELEGPMPILKSSKRLVFTLAIVGGGDGFWPEGLNQSLRLRLRSCLRQSGGAFRRGRGRRAEEGAEKVPREIKNVPQRLKPRCKQSASGTAQSRALKQNGLFQHPLKP